MTTKVDADAMDFSMGRNENTQDPVETNTNANATDAMMGLNNNSQ